MIRKQSLVTVKNILKNNKILKKGKTKKYRVSVLCGVELERVYKAISSYFSKLLDIG